MSGSEGSLTTSCHLFCAVIDNYGDLGVCWRLARHLAESDQLTVTLIVDDLHSFHIIAPGVNPGLIQQSLDTLTIVKWSDETLPLSPADLVIEGFACELPADYIVAMSRCRVPPVWINLEYLSAEAWVEGCHGLGSTHPGTGLIKHFWFPGFSPATGGLLRTRHELQLFLSAASEAQPCRQISLFGYEQAAIATLLDALAADTRSSTLHVFAGRSLPEVSEWLGQALMPGDNAVKGMLSIRVLPMLDHADYDRLLARCDLNLVRGEDSFVRAQWAGAPMLWQIYPQDENAHLVKLAAWQARVEAEAETAGTPMPASWAEASQAWNAGTDAPASPDWSTFLADLPAMRRAMQSWRHALLAQPDLATQLMRFYANRVESRPK